MIEPDDPFGLKDFGGSQNPDLEKIQKSLKKKEAVAQEFGGYLDNLRNSPDFIGKEKFFEAAQKRFDDAELSQ
jgi:hypothetical protein